MDHGFNLGSLFWIFLIIVSLQPLMQQRMLTSARLKLMRALERRRGSRVITLIHRQEQMSFLGFPLVKFIDIQDSEQILRAIKLTDGEVPIDLVLHTPGGLVLAAEQIARAIKRHPAKTTVFVPHYAMSGGTLIALAADEIVMDHSAVLGPVDPQLGQRAAASLVRVVEAKGVKECDDETLIQADQARMALKQVGDTVRELLQGQIPDGKVDALTERLSQGHFTHDHAFGVDDVRESGLSVSTDMPREIYELMELHPQPTRHAPTVEFIPVPYHRKESGTHQRRG